jgi:hypothetical protein
MHDNAEPVLRMLADLAGEVDVYVTDGPTDLDLGLVNGREAWLLRVHGLVKPGSRDEPLRLTDRGRRRLREAGEGGQR